MVYVITLMDHMLVNVLKDGLVTAVSMVSIVRDPS